DLYPSPDGEFLYASTQEAGVMVIHLPTMTIVRQMLGTLIGYNPLSNHLFFTNGRLDRNYGTQILVVDAATHMEVSVVDLEGVRGVAPVPGSSETILAGATLSTGGVDVPFMKIVDATGLVIADERVREWLGVADDPPAGAPSFDVTGDYFIIGSRAFKRLTGGGFEPVPEGIAPGPLFEQLISQYNNQRVVDPVGLTEFWYGDAQSNNTIAMLSLNGTNLPVAVRPGVSAERILLDSPRGRAIFVGQDRLVFLHYADTTAASRLEVLDLTSVIDPLLPHDDPCSAASPCPHGLVCMGETDTAFTGVCKPNPRLPYLPYCGGFTQEPCDVGFTCSVANASNPNSNGVCTGSPDPDPATNGPPCSGGLCPVGMTCNGVQRCEPKSCGGDGDCAAWPGEVCGQVDLLGQVCVMPGPLPDDAPCNGPEECEHGVCLPLAGAWYLGAPFISATLFDGYRGLMVCSRPCVTGNDCEDGKMCMLHQHFFMPPNYISAEAVWKTHRKTLAPFCEPAQSLSVVGCSGTCTSDQVCAMTYTWETGQCLTP
ncbi:hypothetical protein KJ865_11115, partial [Myxococcota bacterium]|nr:hypothetical protein [Myxococcota bacterium]